MTDHLHIAQGLELPRELIVGKIAILGISGSGKTQTARKLAEAMMGANAHIVVFAPAAGWYGLRSSRDGKSKGYPIAVFGGDHGDAALRVDSGAIMAAAVIKRRFNVIFDMVKMSEAEVRRFTTDFLNYLNLHNRSPIHLFFDEFDVICPQQKGANTEEARAAVNTTVRRKRIQGIGETMITQNPQDVDKSVLNMAEVQIVMRTVGSQPMDAVEKWLGRTRTKPEVQEMVRSLPSIPTGHGWISAANLGIFGRFHFLLCKTFDSSRTPELGETIAAPQVLAEVDITKLGAQIEAQVKEEQENDPKFLKDEVAKLRKELAKRGDAVGVTAEAVAAMEQEIEELRPLRDQVGDAEQRIAEQRERFEAALAPVTDAFKAAGAALAAALEELGMEDPATILERAVPAPQPTPVRASAPSQAPAAPREPSAVPEGDFRPNEPQQKILNAMATLTALRFPYTDALVAVNADTLPRARGYEVNMQILRREGLLGRGNGRPTLTDAGAAVAVAERTMPTFINILARLKVSEPQSKILQTLKREPLLPVALAEMVGTTERSRGFEVNIQTLRRKGYIERETGVYRLADWLGRLR